MDAVAKAPWMGLRRVSEAHKALSLHLTNSCYKVRPEGCGVGLADLPAQDALAEPPWMGLRRVREPNTTSLPKTFFAGTKKPANKRALSKLTITQGLVILVKLFFDTCRFT